MLGLYPALAGADWDELPAAVRALHGGRGVRARGRFQVRWSAHAPVRWLARLTGLPRPGESVGLELQIVPEAGMETWRRVFEGRPFVTRQWAEGPLLVERFGRPRAALRAPGRPRRAVLRAARRGPGPGPLAAALPRPLWPRVEAFVSGELVPRVEVELRLPLLGTLCR